MLYSNLSSLLFLLLFQCVNLSYQDLGHGYQTKEFIRVLRKLIRAESIELIENGLADLTNTTFPRYSDEILVHIYKCKSCKSCLLHFSLDTLLFICTLNLFLQCSENYSSALQTFFLGTQLRVAIHTHFVKPISQRAINFLPTHSTHPVFLIEP